MFLFQSTSNINSKNTQLNTLLNTHSHKHSKKKKIHRFRHIFFSLQKEALSFIHTETSSLWHKAQTQKRWRLLFALIVGYPAFKKLKVPLTEQWSFTLIWIVLLSSTALFDFLPLYCLRKKCLYPFTPYLNTYIRYLESFCKIILVFPRSIPLLEDTVFLNTVRYFDDSTRNVL